MNKLVTEGPAWLASDIHLGPDNPKTADLFFGFLDQAGAHAGALFLLGDIFDVWIGDDWIIEPPPWLARTLNHLRATAKRVPLYIGHGNRDFLMGSSLAQHIGAHLLDQQCILQVKNQTVLLAHGDEFCIADRAYQRFRRLVRHPWTQKLYLSLSIENRLGIALRARQKSMQKQTRSNTVWHDVDLTCIHSALVQAGTHHLIHGHTHRPGHYEETADRYTIDRWVLPDWEADHLAADEPIRGGWLVLGNDGITLLGVDGKAFKK
ncbi:UDP-2,3-diacylglucosamine diphosphatase [Orrella daihaiensis]|uniref:UDP-2,3-diacylglucosamine hydrolase n=1 Tax=Orrella daihaiensis TaxID=2782176 RepID=A0ABY4AR85_9BURK|nr:UDP-2,3-diacylglucosamine diphosphatase [Orrella daihaiensis]UOD51565.1 UDP-2,3-diacylglucosamine diphosphatase [Orrella daihaiensis]